MTHQKLDRNPVRPRVVAASVALILSLAAAPTVSAQEQRSAWNEAGYGLGAALLTFVYGPAKIFYAGAGALTGGAAYLLTGLRGDVAHSIITPALRGDYVVTPEVLRGERPISFAGRDPETEPYPYE